MSNTDKDFLYEFHVMNSDFALSDFTRVKLSSNENERNEMIKWIKRNCVGEYIIFAEHNNAFLKDSRDRTWYELTFK
jgi:hypothetical protein